MYIVYPGVISIAMVEIEVGLRSSAIVARADIESLTYDGNDSSAFLSDSNDHLANIIFLKAPSPDTVQILREPGDHPQKGRKSYHFPTHTTPTKFQIAHWGPLSTQAR